MEKITSIFLFLFFTINTSGQQSKIDSLINVLSSTHTISEKEIIANELFDLIWKNNLASKMDTLILFKINLISEQAKNINLETKSYALLTQKYMSLEDSLKSHIYLSRLKKTIPNKKFEYYYNFRNLEGRVYIHFFNYQLAVDTYEEVIKEYNRSPKGSVIFELYTNLSNSYGRLSNTELEAKNLIKANEYASKFNDYENKASSYYNLAWVYLKIQNYEKSVKYFEEGIKIINDKNLSKFKYFHHGLGLAYSRWGKYEKALQNNFLALDFFRETKNIRFEFDTLNNIAVVYNKMNKPEMGSEFALKALDIAYVINHPIAINGAKYTYAVSQKDLKNYENSLNTFLSLAKDTIGKYENDIAYKNSLFSNLSHLYEVSGNISKSYYFYKKHKTLNDSINNLARDSKFAELETKYQFEKKEKENLQLKAENSKQILANQKANNRNWILGLSLLILLIIAFSIWRRYKAETKAKQIISEQKTKIEKLQKEFHHRLKNDFRSINSFISLVQKQFSDVEFKERLNELKNRVTSMFKVHEILLQEGDITQVKAHPYLLELSQNVEEKHNNKNIKLICNVDETETIIADKAIPFGIVLNEFVTNSYKYAFDENGGEISIDFKSDNQNHNLTLKDNGKGLPVDFNIENLRSLGMSIIPMFADLYNGSYKIDGTNGVSLLLTLPKKVI